MATPILILVTLAVFSGLVNGDFFPTPQFSGEDVTQKMFGSAETSDVFPIATGDFNADKLTDIVAVPSDRSAILLFLAHEEPPFLRLMKKCIVQTPGKAQQLQILGAAPGDFTGDGLMDLLVTMRHEETKNVEVIIFEGNSTDLICQNQMQDTLTMAVEPLVVDLNGDMIMDLVSEEYVNNDNNDRNTRKVIWIFNSTDKLNPKKYEFEVLPNIYKKQKEWEKRPMSNPALNAFVDMDGDSIPELVTVTTDSDGVGVAYFIHSYKIITGLSDGDIKFNYTGEPIRVKSEGQNQMNTMGQPIFVDFNRDGRLMLLLPYCAQIDCGNKAGLGKDEQGIKVIYNGTVTDLNLSPAQYDGIYWGWARPYHTDYELLKKENYYSRSIVLRVGDYNLDGFPDIIAILEATGAGRVNKLLKRAVIFENVPCKDPDKKKCPFQRTFSPNFKVLSQYSNVTLGTFFDIHEDGLIDVLIVKKANGTVSGPGRFELRAFQNSPDYDSNFIKVMVLTGRACPKCPKLGIPYGNLLTGPMISYKTKTQEGALQTAVAVQNYRSTNMPMDLPYVYF